ncbi:fatty acid desaturase [Rhodobacter ferrooxidans]|uniref:Fatty acid desaturase n=1 Tax=Rhodobacter ferrooxidans TaxID=371731 RepID=C8S048_9RHOB|nr:fatty acid desaturase [Rhodobacter sp. SW2]EEW25657.1 fatty acid desaturase [Rhodobacter sp. SW2]
MSARAPVFETKTLGLLAATYALWIFGTTWGTQLSPLLGIILTGIAIAQFCSLQHEALHGHPFANRALNAALVFPGLTLTVPYGRFRDTHLAHHHDPILTDPYDDPESNYLDPAVWDRLHPAAKLLLRLNNTLLGRITLGPLLGNALWLKAELALIRKGDRAVIRDWLLHLAGVALVVWWIIPAAMSGWGYLAAAWIGHALLKIRTFLEHRAHALPRARTVIIEDRGPLALLFLNNNLHVVHHMHPTVPWYDLPGLYAANTQHYQRHNDGYRYRSYAEIFARYLLRAKDPVPHPLYPRS